ncbi:ABC transporter permease [Sagittula stellata]|uniref:Amino acid ABC transporter, permease protein n=1 Tax=Sagittula stellata (strain ATCC 700073 / DSM 11524 / E-37) TaxID=388399 RepID=A3K7R2_SAGS3|nr:ABC transporter permease subunit [Sagittula stellata]EBA06684.1 amino acid ABC transporter, permease protein [Sagittula stellata E-37]
MPDLDGFGWLLIDGLKLTLFVAIASMAGALVFGLLAAIGKLFAPRPARILIDTYTTFVRGVPELVLLLIIYYGVPTLVQNVSRDLGVPITLSINPFVAGIGTLTLIYAAFACEVYRAAYAAVPVGQREAAYALGLSRAVTFRKVELPQMMRYALPGLGNVWMVVVKATALISIIQLPELMRNADIAARSTRQPFTFFFAACLLYLAITAISMWGQGRLERWAARGTTESRA